MCLEHGPGFHQQSTFVCLHAPLGAHGSCMMSLSRCAGVPGCPDSSSGLTGRVLCLASDTASFCSAFNATASSEATCIALVSWICLTAPRPVLMASAQARPLRKCLSYGPLDSSDIGSRLWSSMLGAAYMGATSSVTYASATFGIYATTTRSVR